MFIEIWEIKLNESLKSLKNENTIDRTIDKTSDKIIIKVIQSY